MPTSAKTKITTLNYVIIYVKDTDKATKFYRDTLGMTVKVEHPGWVEFETGSTTLALHGIENAPAKPKEGMPDICFGVENVFESYDELKKSGVKFSHEPHQVCEEGDKVGFSAGFNDEDGNSFSIFSYVDKDKVRK